VQEKEQQDTIKTAELIRRGTPVAPIRTNADGGMHPVFVAAVKRNQIGVAPSAFLLASAPGTIPATVRPPRIPELADTPLMTASTSRHTSEPQTQMAIAEPETPAAKPAASGGLFGSLFSTKSASASESKSESPFDRMASFIGLGGSEPKNATKAPLARQAAAATAPKPKPATSKTQAVTQPATRVASHGAIRPKPAADAEPEPARSAEAARPAPSPWPAVVPPTTTAQSPVQAPAPAGTAMNGAAPVVPTGTFENRWSAFR
jgi:hypothetical protein